MKLKKLLWPSIWLSLIATMIWMFSHCTPASQITPEQGLKNANIVLAVVCCMGAIAFLAALVMMAHFYWTKKLIAISAIIATLCLTAHAQTGGNFPTTPATNTLPIPTSLLPGGVSQIASDFGAFFKDAQPYFGTNGSTLIGAGIIQSGNKWGGLVDVTVMSLDANNQVTLGFATAYLDGTWYDASLALKAGTTWKVPLIGSIYTSVESGPGYNFKAGHVMAQNFAMATKRIQIGKVDFSIFAGAGNISDRAGLAKILGVNFNVKF